MSAPKRIYLELNNVPPCNFGALWYEDAVPGGVAYRLESEVNEELAKKYEKIAELQNNITDYRRTISYLNKKNIDLHNDYEKEVADNIRIVEIVKTLKEKVELLKTALETVADKVLFSTHSNLDIGGYAQGELLAISNWAKSLSTRQDD